MAYGTMMKRLNPCGDSQIMTLLAQFCPGARSILDAGCGRGDRLAALAEALPGLRLCGTDCDAENAAAAAERCPDAEIVTGDITRLSYGDGSFDAVLCECTLSLTGSPSACLAEFRRVLRPGGILLLSDLCAAGAEPPLVLPESDGLRQLLFRDWLGAAAAAAGFRERSYLDCSDAMLTMAAQMIFDGSFCSCVGTAGAAVLKQYHCGYGLWILEKEV